MLWAGAFLVEFLSQGRYAPLSALTSTPTREPLAVPGASVDRPTTWPPWWRPSPRARRRPSSSA